MLCGEQGAMELSRELFVDAHLVRKAKGVRLVCHSPASRGSVFTFDKPWEGPFCNYATVIQSRTNYRLYYRGLPVPKHNTGDESLCVAESYDGQNFTRLSINKYRQCGTAINNVIIPQSQCGTHSMGIMFDNRRGVAPNERWKGIGVEQRPNENDNHLVAFTSPDGIQWNRVTTGPTITNDTVHFAFDSQNVPLWSEAEQKYIVYGRTWQRGTRWISRWESTDFRTWTKSKFLTFSGADNQPLPDTHFYINQFTPYFRAPHILLGTAARFFPGRQVLSPDEAKAVAIHPDYFKDTSDAVLLTTRGGTAVHRDLEGTLLRPGIGASNWVSRANYPACGIVQTGAAAMSMYACRATGTPSAYIERLEWPLDRIGSVSASGMGSFETPPLVLGGRDLAINFATSAGGEVVVEVLDVNGRVLPGFGKSDAQPLIGDFLTRRVAFKRDSVKSLGNRPVILRFSLVEADLFAIEGV